MHLVFCHALNLLEQTKRYDFHLKPAVKVKCIFDTDILFSSLLKFSKRNIYVN